MVGIPTFCMMPYQLVIFFLSLQPQGASSSIAWFFELVSIYTVTYKYQFLTSLLSSG